MVERAITLWYSLKSIRRTHRLVVQSAMLGSILLSLFGFLVPTAQATRSGTDVQKVSAPFHQEENLHVAAPAHPISQGNPDCELPEHIPAQVRQWCDLITRKAAGGRARIPKVVQSV